MPSLVEIGQMVLEKKNINFVNIFSLLFPLGKGRGLHLKKLKSPSPKDNLIGLVDTCPVVLEKKILKKSSMYFSQFHNYDLLVKGVALHLNKLECPSPKDALLQVWLKFDGSFWERRFFKNLVHVFLLFRNYLPSEKGGVIHFNKIQESIVPSLVEFDPVLLEKIFKLCQCIFAIS